MSLYLIDKNWFARDFLSTLQEKLDLHIKVPMEKLSRFSTFEALKIHEKVIRLSMPQNLTQALLVYTLITKMQGISMTTQHLFVPLKLGGKQLTEMAFNFKARPL